MNLQIASPYITCPYRCPFCVAGVEGEFPFDDLLWEKYPDVYLAYLRQTVLSNRYKHFVVTGSTEPTLFPKWLKAVEYMFYLLKQDGHQVHVEIQTKDYGWRPDFDAFDVVAYSHHKIPVNPIGIRTYTVRDVFILLKSLSIDDILKYHSRKLCVDPFAQTTVKVLANNSYGAASIDRFVNDNRYVPTDLEVAKLKMAGIWYDPNCNEGEGRYHIFRPNGNFYSEWGSTAPLIRS